MNLRANILILIAYFSVSFFIFKSGFLDGYLIAFDDSFTVDFPLRKYYAGWIKDGFSLWMPYEFMGMPLLGIIHLGVFYPLNFIYFILPAEFAFNLNIVIHYVLSAFFMFLYARAIKIDKFPAFLGGLLFGFTGFMIANKNYTSMINAASWVPLLLLCYEKIKTDLRLKYVIFAALVFGVLVSAGHPQIVMYAGMIISAFILFNLFYISKGKKFKFLIYCSIPLLLGVLINLPVLMETKELSGLSYRAGNLSDYGYFTNFSVPPLLLIKFLFPYLLDKYLDVHSYGFKYLGYIGILPLFIALLSIFRYWKNDLNAKFWSLVAGGSFFLMMGSYNPLYKVMQYVPVYNLFRNPSRALFLLDMALIILFVIGLDKLLKYPHKSFLKTLQKMLLLVFILFVIPIFFLGVRGFIDIHLENIVIPGILIILSYFAVSLLFNREKQGKLFRILLSLILLSEVFYFGAFATMDWRNPSKYWAKTTEINKYLNDSYLSFLSRQESGRAFYLNSDGFLTVRADLYDEPVPILFVPEKISMLSGYDAFVYDELNKITGVEQNGMSYKGLELLKNNNILNMLNVRYLVVLNEEIYLKYRDSLENKKGAYKKVYDEGKSRVYENLNTLPRAYPVEKIEFLKDIDEVVENLNSSEFNPAKKAYLYDFDKDKLNKTVFSRGSVSIADYKNDEITLNTDFNGEGFVILADIYHPGWRAYINNTEIPIYKTNGILRGIVVPQGKNIVKFKYQPDFWWWSPPNLRK